MSSIKLPLVLLYIVGALESEIGGYLVDVSLNEVKLERDL